MKLGNIIFVISLIVFSSNANAVLVERLGGQAYYDTEADLTWLADANYAQSSGYDADGLMDWATSMQWASGLNIDGVTGWRLPETLVPDPSCYFYANYGNSDGSNCTGSEMGNLYYNMLGGVYTGSLDAPIFNSNYGLFKNIEYDNPYWSSTAQEFYNGSSLSYASIYGFSFQFGTQTADFPYDINAPSLLEFRAWAVHSGDVATVPLPSAIWLFSIGLAGLLGMARRKELYLS